MANSLLPLRLPNTQPARPSPTFTTTTSHVVGVRQRQIMQALATQNRFGSVSVSAQCILRPGNYSEMVRTDTPPITAQVIDFQPIWDRSDEQDIRHPMSRGLPFREPFIGPGTDLPVSGVGYGAAPFPTSFSALDVRVETRFEGSRYATPSYSSHTPNSTVGSQYA